MSDFEAMALAQHFSLPTRLLDWSFNPLVALYFAVASEPKDKPARVHAVRADMGQFELVDPMTVREVTFVRPPSLAARIVNQKGAFSIHPTPPSDWRPQSSYGKSSVHAYEYFDIEPAQRPRMREILFVMGVDPSSIRHDIEGVSETLQWQLENQFGMHK
jgi:hypothetical protein